MKNKTESPKEKLLKHNINSYEFNNFEEEFINTNSLITATCPKHGTTKVKAYRDYIRYNQFNFCKKCIGDNFIERSKQKYGDKYDYSKVVFESYPRKVTIICPKHGDIFIPAMSHLMCETGCTKCGAEKSTTSFRIKWYEMEERFKQVHNNKYTYPNLKDEYVNVQSIITGYCKEHNNTFKIKADWHGKAGCKGCTKCYEYTSVGESKILKFLTENNILYNHQHTFPDCLDKGRLIFDFYIPDIGTCIEFDGRQHFIGGFNFGSTKLKDTLSDIQRRDRIKNEYCKTKGIKLIRIPHDKINQIDNILKSELGL